MDAFLDTSKINNSRNKLSTLLPLWALCASASLLLGWLSHFLAPQPLPLTAPLLGASASVIHHTLTFPSTPLVQLVVSFPLPSASLPPPSCHDSARCCFLGTVNDGKPILNSDVAQVPPVCTVSQLLLWGHLCVFLVLGKLGHDMVKHLLSVERRPAWSSSHLKCRQRKATRI